MTEAHSGKSEYIESTTNFADLLIRLRNSDGSMNREVQAELRRHPDFIALFYLAERVGPNIEIQE